MSGSIHLRGDTKAFQDAVDRFMKNSRRSRGEVMKEQARGILRSVIAITPPGNTKVERGKSGQITTSGKKAGEMTLMNDLKKIFTIATQKQLEEELKAGGTDGYSSTFAHKGAKALGRFKVKVLDYSAMRAWHQSHRNPGTGRAKNVNRKVTTGLRRKDMAGLDIGFVSKQDFQRYYNEVKKMIGFLASGWMPAVRSLGLKGVPSWITKHSAPGGVTIRSNDSGIRIEASNKVKYASKMRDLERLLGYAIDYQRVAIEKRIKFAEDREMRRSGLKK